MSHPGPVPPGAELAETIRDLTRRVATLESSRRMPATTQEAGTYTVVDADGNARVVLGVLPDGLYGVTISDGARDVLKVTDAGLELPVLNVPSRPVNTSVSVTSGTFVSVYESIVGRATHEALRCNVTVVADPGTDGELRLNLNSPIVQTDVQAISGGGAGAQQVFTWNWAPGWVLDSGPKYIQVQARRTAGAGVIAVFWTNYCYLGGVDTLGATLTGL